MTNFRTVQAGALSRPFSDQTSLCQAVLIALAGCLGLCGTAGVFAEEAVLIGGGPDPAHSPTALEDRARWIRTVLDGEGLPLTTFFTDGKSIGPDVYVDAIGPEAEGALMPLARLFSDDIAERRRYRENELERLGGGTARETLEPLLEELLARNRQAPLLLIHDGQGSASTDRNVADAGIDLWGGTTWQVDELHALLQTRRPGARTPFRYLFMQCHSGSFHRLAYQHASKGRELATATRCGFTAEPAWNGPAVCNARPVADEPDTYGTLFLAALADREQDGSVLTRDPDVDADGAVSLREAHFHAIGQGHGTNLARSTSEDWLENWQPWYLRWLPVSSHLPNNDYAQLFRTLATRTGLPLGERVGRTLRERLATHAREIAVLRVDRDSQKRLLSASRLALQRRATTRWPALGAPYTSAYRTLAASGKLPEIAAWVARQPGYSDLVDNLDLLSGLEQRIREREREMTTAHKLLRLRRLADLRGQLAEHGTSEAQASYSRLLACEEHPLVIDSERPDVEVRDISAESSVD